MISVLRIENVLFIKSARIFKSGDTFLSSSCINFTCLSCKFLSSPVASILVIIMDSADGYFPLYYFLLGGPEPSDSCSATLYSSAASLFIATPRLCIPQVLHFISKTIHQILLYISILPFSNRLAISAATYTVSFFFPALHFKKGYLLTTCATTCSYSGVVG